MPMRKLLLISSSRVHGTGFLEHCQTAIADHLNSVQELLFVPYALRDHQTYEATVGRALAALKIQVTSIHRSTDPVTAVQQAQAIFIGGGNTFRLLKTLYNLNLLDPIRHAVNQRGIPYMGSSAGTNLACPTIRTTNDMPIVEPPSFESLGLIPFQINPHYLDADPNSTHQGETRLQRLTEYLEENRVPVACIREGSWLVVNNDQCLLGGTTGMLLLSRGEQPVEFGPTADVSFLLNG